MKFSIIIPVYNVEKYLVQCVKSVLKQEYKDFEIILVDDGSTDSSPKICDDLEKSDSRIKVIHKINGGSSDARNVGTNYASGDYVIYLDSDDYISSKKFFTHIYQKTTKNDDIIIYKFRKYYENTGVIEECNYGFPKLETFDTLEKRIEYLVKCDAFYCSGWSKAVKRSLLIDNDIQFEKGIIGEDQEWYYHVLMKAKSITGIDAAYIVYRQRSNSVTSSWKMKNLVDCIYVIDKWENKIKQSHITTEYKIALLNSVAKLYCNLLIAYTRFDDKEKNKYYIELKKHSRLLKYHINPRVNSFYKIYKLCGFNFLMFSLKVMCKIR